jgi:hypothetical protein
MRNTFRRGVRRFTGAVVALTMLCLVATSARAQVLSQLPSDAFVVLKIKNLQDVSSKVAQLSQQWGLANMRPELNDPLGSILGLTGLGQGLNKNGEAGVAVMPPGPNQNEPHVVIVVPVTDYKAFTASLPNAGAEGEFQTFRPGEGGPMIYASNWGQYAALSNQKQLLKKGQGVKAPAAIAKELATKDLVAYVNVKPVRQMALDAIRQNKPMILDQIERGMAQGQGIDPKYGPVLKAYIGQFFTAAETFMSDTDGASLGINFAKEGISTSLVAEFAPGSYLGKNVAMMKNSDASFTAGLPDAKYFIYAGFINSPGGGEQLFKDFVKPIEDELVKLGPDGKPIADYIQAVKDYMAAIKQANFGFVAPPAAQIGQQAGIIQMVGVIRGDVQKITASMTQMLKTQQEFMKIMGQGNIVTMTHTPKAKTIAGVQLDAVTMKFNPANTPQEQQMLMMMNMFYGPGGVTTYAGQINQDTLIMTTGVTDDMVSKAIQAAKTNADPLRQGVAAKVDANLPKNRAGAVYVPVDVIATTILDVMAAKGMPGGVKIPPNLPPLGAALAVEGTAVRVDGYIPSQTVQTLIAAGMQMYLQQMPGDKPGL